MAVAYTTVTAQKTMLVDHRDLVFTPGGQLVDANSSGSSVFASTATVRLKTTVAARHTTAGLVA